MRACVMASYTFFFTTRTGSNCSVLPQRIHNTRVWSAHHARPLIVSASSAGGCGGAQSCPPNTRKATHLCCIAIVHLYLYYSTIGMYGIYQMHVHMI